VARAGGLQVIGCAAHGRQAHRLRLVEVTASEAVAHARLTAGGGALVAADLVGVGDTGLDGPADTQSRRLIAADAGAAARDVAADAVGAESGGTLGAGGADGPLRFGAAAARDAFDVGRAVRVRAAIGEALSRRRVA